MSKNRLGMRRSGGGGGTSRISGLTHSPGGLAPGQNVLRPYMTDTPQDNVRDSSKTSRISGLGTKKK
jgi:hypothetical protein